jgi:hypothetical protein
MLHDFYCSPNVIRMNKSKRIRWVGHVASMGEDECKQGCGGKGRRKETTRCEDNVKMYFTEIG